MIDYIFKVKNKAYLRTKPPWMTLPQFKRVMYIEYGLFERMIRC